MSHIDDVIEFVVDEMLQRRVPLRQAVQMFEAALVRKAVRKGGSQTEAARILSIHRNTLINKLKGGA